VVRTKFQIVTLVLFSSVVLAQNSFDRFLKPSDTLDKARLKTIVISEAVIGGTTLIGLNQLWYADYPHSNFHFINDNAEWLQMDKMGHFFSTYQLGSLGANALKWSGASRKSQLLYGATLGVVFMSVVEVFDGYSSQWGYSVGDELANISGAGLYVSQELLWKEQRIIPKVSYHATSYAAQNPAVLGSNFQEQILKDYNGQTYWLSANMYSFTKWKPMPKWLNLAFGYGAEGMLSGNPSSADLVDRYRQFYLSLDVDLTKIQTKSHFVKTLCTVFNTLKIPAPTIEIKGNGGFVFHYLYF
jgi:hypothetical protein